jgi:alpha-ketoglutaric semialdehyde dehydrogenase
MEITGQNLIAGKPSAEGKTYFAGINPATGETLPAQFSEATDAEIDRALDLAASAFESYSQQSAENIAGFLEAIAVEIVELGDSLIARAQSETALPEARLVGERARTVGQLKMFAELIKEGSWLEARIDRALPDRKPLPKPDLRRKLIPLGPVVVFGASNFPLAFSVAGGDTASALAAGNTVVVKAHPAHPGTSELVARAMLKAAGRSKMPPGVFSLVHGRSHESGLRLVCHRATKAVGFTGSLQGGRALFDAAAARPEPIPVYAEMGSTNPVFVLPGALKSRGMAIAEGLIQSVTMGVGQFCTNPGLVFGLQGDNLREFIEKAGQLAAASAPGTMLYQGVRDRFAKGVVDARSIEGVTVPGQSTSSGKPSQAQAIVLTASARAYLSDPRLKEEIFGPATVIVTCGTTEVLERAARELPGQLTATIHGTEEDLRDHRKLVAILQQKVGRLLFNGFPTGVEVCPSMHHGGPYPATTNSLYTSVGTAAIQRFVRPLCFQGFPDEMLPVELRNKNSRKIWRLVDGQFSKDDL